MAETTNTLVESDGANVTIVGIGSLDLTNAQRFREELARASETANSVTVDLTRSNFIDTAILEYLARAARMMLKRDRRLKVVVADATHPQHVLRIVGFAAVMDIETAPNQE